MRIRLPIIKQTFSLNNCKEFSSLQKKPPNITMETRGFNAIRAKIDMCGPITIADYMREVLLNPVSGYYMTRDVFGKSGDFITSPEISQLFGELIGVWSINEWHKLACPNPYLIIELGPGRGTMMGDILRVYDKLHISEGVSIHLVEISSELSLIQAKNLCTSFTSHSDKPYYQEGITKSAIPVYWYKSIDLVPKLFSFIVAHEFFDALPIHKFQKTSNGWREILVDIDKDCTENKLHFVISRKPSPASLIFIKEDDCRNHVEVCPQAGVIMKEIANRLVEHGGFALIADYGHFGEKEDTFRAFRNHQLHDPLVDPGNADLTADVDFSYLRNAVSNQLIALGPVSQHSFLKSLHIDVRLEVLLKKCKTAESKKSILSGYDMIMNQSKMGERFKFMAFFPLVLDEFIDKFPVVGFQK